MIKLELSKIKEVRKVENSRVQRMSKIAPNTSYKGNVSILKTKSGRVPYSRASTRQGKQQGNARA